MPTQNEQYPPPYSTDPIVHQPQSITDASKYEIYNFKNKKHKKQ